MKIRILEGDLHLIDLQTRMPFRYGIATMTHTPHAFVRLLSPRLGDDRPLAPDIEAVAVAIRDGSLIAAVEAEIGELA